MTSMLTELQNWGERSEKVWARASDLPRFSETIKVLRKYKSLIEVENLKGETALAFDIDSPFMATRRWEYGWALSQLSKGEFLRILDIGSGYRPFTLLLHDLGYSVTAVDDESWPVHEDLKRKLESKSVTYVQADATESLPFPDNAFDAAVCISVIEHVQSPGALIAEAMRVVKRGGVLVLTLDYSDGLGAFRPEGPIPSDVIRTPEGWPVVGVVTPRRF